LSEPLGPKDVDVEVYGPSGERLDPSTYRWVILETEKKVEYKIEFTSDSVLPQDAKVVVKFSDPDKVATDQY
jgi:hypothetical protein